MTLGVPEKVQELCRWIEAYKPDLVIVDAFYMMHDGEGFGKDLGPIMKRLKAIRGAYNCAIWVIDHDRKGKAEASNGENPIDRLWGGRQKSAAVDAIVESRPVKGSHGETFLDIVKLRGAKPADPIRVKLYEDYRLLIEGTEEDSPKGSAHVVYEWLCREGASRTIRQIIAGTGLADRTVRGAVSELHRDGLARPFSGPGTAKTWFGIRRAEAEAEASEEFNFADEEEE
jgi:predicted DNA-binding transcriptional regulator